MSRAGSTVSAAISSAARAEFAAASACGTVGGRSPGPRRWTADIRHADHRGQPRHRGQPGRPGPGGRRPGDREAARQARRHVVRVPLEPGREPQHVRVGQGRPAGGQGPRGQQAGHDRRGRGAEAEPVRDRVDAPQPDARRLDAQLVERGPHGADHQMASPRGRGLLSRAGHLDRQPVGDDPRLDHVVQGQRQAQGVETRAQVRAGGRDADGHRPVRPARAGPGTRAGPVRADIGGVLRPGQVRPRRPGRRPGW